MKRIATALAMVVALSVPVGAHEVSSEIDGRNPRMGVDLKRATFDHSDTHLTSVVRTWGGVTDYTLAYRGAMRLVLWRNTTNDRVYWVHVFHNGRGLRAPVFRSVEGEELGMRVGTASVTRLASNEFSVSVRRNIVEADGRGIKWRWAALYQWCEQRGEWCMVDRLPTDIRFYWHNF